jgi:hypothetical protein
MTIRVQVNLPHNQKTTVRVVPDILLKDLLKQICDENYFDQTKYMLTLHKQQQNNDLIINEQKFLNNKLSYFEVNEVNLVYRLNNENNNSNKDNNNNSMKSKYFHYFFVAFVCFRTLSLSLTLSCSLLHSFLF